MDAHGHLLAPPRPVNGNQFELLARAIDTVGSAILIIDLNNRIVWLNQAVVRLSGYDASEVLGATPALFDAEPALRSTDGALRQIAPGRCERVNRHKNGAIYITDETVSVLTDGHGDISHYIALQHDITQEKQRSQQELHRANHDALTGLACRARFLALQQCAIAAAARTGGLVGVLFLDLDGFKAINDTFGHHTGDTVLRAVAERLQRAVRATDTVARFGGDEFVILLPAIVQRCVAIQLSRKIVALLAEPIAIADGRHAVTVSAGIAFYPDHGVTGEALLAHADQAMYRAKRDGGNLHRLLGIERAQAWRPYLDGRISKRDAGRAGVERCACSRTYRADPFPARRLRAAQ